MHRFYAPPPPVLTALGNGPKRILDLGGNVGLFGLWSLVNWPNADLTAFEPDPSNADRYRAFLGSNAPHWTLKESVASNVDGHARFSAMGRAGSSLSHNDEGVTVEQVDVLPLLNDFDLVKIDIEGGEWAILLDERFASVQVKVIALEFHPARCPTQDASAAAVAALSLAGFSTVPIMDDGNGVGMLWGYRPAK